MTFPRILLAGRHIMVPAMRPELSVVKNMLVNKESEIWQFVAGKVKEDRALMLLVVAESTGSSPGRQGFKMAVTPDDLCGSIGGGIMEVNLVEQARALLPVPPAAAAAAAAAAAGDSSITATGPETKTDLAAVIQQVHRKGDKNPSGMICSGKQTIIFRLLTSKDAGTVDMIIGSLEKHRRDTLIIRPKNFSITASKDDTNDFTFLTCSETDFFYKERLGPKNEIFIVGGGHCALALSELLSKMDFYIRLFDDRPQLNTMAKNTFAHEKHLIDSYQEIAEEIPGGQNAYVVVMTVGFSSDEVVIRRLLDKTFKYFGVLGSRAKMAQLMKNLKGEGHPREKLERIRTPVGLAINSRTPEEIAVSIAAEIIFVKNTKR